MTVAHEKPAEAGQSQAPRTMDRASLALLSMGHLFDDVSQGALPAMLPFFIAAHNLSYSAAAGLILAVTMSSSILQPLLGQFSDRHSAPWLVPLGLFLSGAGLAVASVMPDYLLIFMMIGLSGIGVAAFHPEAARFANYASGARRATGMSMFSIGGNAGFAVGPLLATPIMLTLGLQGGILLALPSTLMAALLVWQLPRFVAHRQASARRAAASRIQRADNWRAFALLTGAVITRSVLFYGMNTFIPLYWRDVLHQPVAAGGIALTILFTFGAAGTLTGGWLADRYGRRRVVIAAMAILTALLALFVSIQDATLAMAMLAPLGLALFAPTSVLVVMGQEYLPNRVGTASGVTLGLAVSFGGLMAPIFGQVADAQGLGTVMSLLVFVPVTGILFVAALPKEHRAAA